MAYMNVYEDFEELFHTKNKLFKLEDTLLTLSTHAIIDGIFFFASFKNKDNREITSREFKSGCFQGFDGVGMIEKLFDCKISAPILVYNQDDIKKEKLRNDQLFQKRRKGTTCSIITSIHTQISIHKYLYILHIYMYTY